MDLILHVCCADCLLRFLVASSHPLPPNCHQYVKAYQLPTTTSSLTPYRLTLLFANPNIYPRSEYNARLQAVRKLANLLQFPLVVTDYRPGDYFALATSQAQFQQTNRLRERCAACQHLRLRSTLTYARDHLPANTAWSTTMLASRYLDHQQINTLGQQLATHQQPFINPTFALDPDSLQTSCYYKQNYCGCLFSLLEKSQAKYQKP